MEKDVISIQLTKDAYVKTIAKILNSGDASVNETIAFYLPDLLDRYGKKMLWNIAHGYIPTTKFIVGQQILTKAKKVCSWSYSLEDQTDLLVQGSYMVGIIKEINILREQPIVASFHVNDKGVSVVVDRTLEEIDICVEDYG